jgi:hypothetical protein
MALTNEQRKHLEKRLHEERARVLQLLRGPNPPAQSIISIFLCIGRRRRNDLNNLSRLSRETTIR